MTLLAPAADRVVREAVDAVLEGRSKPGAGADVSFATRSSRYRVIHGILKEASDASLVGSRFVGWLFDGGRDVKMSERWDTDARAVLIDGTKGQIVVTSLTRVHVSNALPVLPETVVEPHAAAQGSDGFPTRAGTLHGLPVVDPEPSQEVSFSELAAPAPDDAPAAPVPPQVASPEPAPDASSAATPSPPQATSPVPKRTIPPSPPIPGRQATPIPMGRPQTPLMPMGLPPPPRSQRAQPQAPSTHQGLSPSPFAPPVSHQAGSPVPPAPPSRNVPVPPPPRAPATHLGLAPATRFPPAPQPPIVLEPAVPTTVPVDLASLEEISAQLSVTGELSAAILPPTVIAPVETAEALAADAIARAAAAAPVPPAPETAPGWAGKSAPLPQFDLDDADLDLPTRADPMPPAPPSEEDAVIPLIPRS